jgi:2-dehydropantoate 2-reductase
MRILVLGSGAIGSLIAGYLTRAGRDVTVVDPWFQHVNVLRADGLHVEAVEESFTTDVNVLHPDQLEDFGAADVIVIATKSYDTRQMALLAREHLAPDGIVLSAQNGMNDARVAAAVGWSHVMGSVVVMGAHLTEPGVVHRTSAANTGSLIFGTFDGRLSEQVPTVAEEFTPLGGVLAVKDIWPQRWSKLTLNSMSNALAGLTGLRSTELWTEPLTLDILIALGHETVSVAAADGIRVAPVFGRIPHDLWSQATDVGSSDWKEIAGHISAVGDQRRGKRANIASLLQDILKKRRTEVDYLNGWVARRGRERAVPTPTHDLMISTLRPVENGLIPPRLENAELLSKAVLDRYS